MTVETFILEDNPIPMMPNTPCQSNPSSLPPLSQDCSMSVEGNAVLDFSRKHPLHLPKIAIPTIAARF